MDDRVDQAIALIHPMPRRTRMIGCGANLDAIFIS